MAKSLGTKLSREDADFYDGPVSQRSVTFGPFANANKGAWAPTFYFPYKSSEQNPKLLTAVDLSYYPVANDNSKLRVVTCYRDTEVSKKDLANLGHIYSWEDQTEYFLPWRTEKPILTTGHEQQTDGIMIRGPEETPSYSRFSPMTDVNVPIRSTTIYGNIANNDFGKKLSEAATAEHLFRNYLFSQGSNFVPGIGYVPFTDRSMEWRDALLSEGYNQDRQLKGTGAGDLGRMHAHAVTIYRKHIALSNRLISEAWKLAYARGYKGKTAQEFVDAYIENVIEHELAHVYEKEGLPERVSEYNIRSMHGRVNARRAASRQGTLQGKIYDILSEHWYDSAETFREGRAGRMSRLEAIAEEAMEEAKGMGLEGEEAAAYVSDKVNKYAENNKGKESDSRESKLEETIKESSVDEEPNPEDTNSNYASNEAEPSEAADNPEPANDNAQESQAA